MERWLCGRGVDYTEAEKRGREVTIGAGKGYWKERRRDSEGRELEEWEHWEWCKEQCRWKGGSDAELQIKKKMEGRGGYDDDDTEGEEDEEATEKMMVVVVGVIFEE